MRTEKDVEAYLLQSGRRTRSVDKRPGTFLVETGAGLAPVAVLVDPPLVVLRAHVGRVGDVTGAPGGTSEAALFRKLLELNAHGLVHASYGIEGDHVVLSSALELENLDFNEIQATLDEIDVALAQSLPQIAKQTLGL
ncbi:MAG: hypothetical protein ACREJ3_02865 [Polyangiaceae bacterium]